MAQVVLSNKQILTGLTTTQKTFVKDSLTFDNPAYLAAKKFSRSRYISIPKYLTYYEESGDSLLVPIGYNYNSIPNIQVQQFADVRQNNVIPYPKFSLDLRPAQEEAKSAYLEAQKPYVGKGLIHLPTGKGKTILALNIAKTLGMRTLVLVHKDDLVTGWKKDIDLCFDGKIKPGLIKAKSRVVGEYITIATVQTISRMNKEELAGYTNQFGLVILDECHHIGLKIFNVIDHFNARYKLGLSATPSRTDKLDFTFDLFLGGICFKYQYKEDDEDILPVRVETVKSKFAYEPFYYEGKVFNARDFRPSELPKNPVYLKDLPYSDRPKVPFLVVDDNVVTSPCFKRQVCHNIIQEYKKGHSCIAFFKQKSHIDLYYRYLCQFVPKETILLYYGDSKSSAESMLQKAESRECLITLATYAKATEGTNVKSWEVGFLVSSLNTEKNVEQAVGRIRRRKEGKSKVAVLYDYRFPDSFMLSSHGATRDQVYKKLKLQYTPEIQEKKRSGLFTVGY